MFVPEVAVGFHAQCAAIFVAEPARDGWEIDTAFDANRSEKVAEIMVSDALHADDLRRPIHAVLALVNSHDGGIEWFIGTFGTHFLQH